MAQKEKVDFEVSCVFCPDKFKSPKAYNKHYNKMHSHEEHPESTLYCIACGYAYKRQGHLMNHMRLQHPTFNYKPTNTVMSPKTFVRMQTPNEDEPVPSSSRKSNGNESPVVVEDEPIEVPDETDSNNGSSCSPTDSLTDSVKQCIAAQLEKIEKMEALLDERRKDVVTLEKNIANHKAIVMTLEADLPK